MKRPQKEVINVVGGPDDKTGLISVEAETWGGGVTKAQVGTESGTTWAWMTFYYCGDGEHVRPVAQGQQLLISDTFPLVIMIIPLF